MKIILIFPFFVAALASGQAPGPAKNDSPLAVLEFRWNKDRKETPVINSSNSTKAAPVREVIPENKKFQREARAQLSPGAVDPNTQTIDGRSEALERITQDSRTPKGKAVEGFSYHAKLENRTETATDVIFLEFQFTELANPANLVRRQFLCAVNIKPKNKADIRAFSSLGPSDVISIESLSSGAEKLFDSKVNVNRIEYKNGAILQRKDWNFGALKESIAHAVSTPWGAEVCRGI
jgi:hypothetical protein